jgi:hydroxyethylthiazole kinase-like uncharacterized protein yjeF
MHGFTSSPRSDLGPKAREPSGSSGRRSIQRYLVTAADMQGIEQRLFEAGMPVAALMEKVGQRLAAQLCQDYPRSQFCRVTVLVGPGHNGGDGLVVARELHHRGYQVRLICPLPKLKPLTAQHYQYAQHVGLVTVTPELGLADCDWLIDGLFGFGLGRPLEGAIAALVNQINDSAFPVASLDVPSGIETDSGQVLGTAIRAQRTYCLGLWKRAFCQDGALDYCGAAQLIDFDLPIADITAVLGDAPPVTRLTPELARAALPLPRPANTYKYRVGQLLIVAGSRQYAGAAILTGLGARASGVGMVTLAVPEGLRLTVLAQLPEALVVGCPETETGAIAALPADLNLSRYDTIVLGPGLSRGGASLVRQSLSWEVPLLLDADGLTLLARQNPEQSLRYRPAPTLLTPHVGEFNRLFPELLDHHRDPAGAAQAAAQQSGAVVLLKGACTVVANSGGQMWINPNSTPALARGGSGDVLSGLIGGLMAQGRGQFEPTRDPVVEAAIAGVWWHAVAARNAAQAHTVLGVDPLTLAGTLTSALAALSLTDR